jgi:hypothetical protein
VHPPTLCASTGVSFAFLPQHCIVTQSREEAAKKLYHTLVFNHVQRLARVLDLHYDGSGWTVFRRNLEVVVPRGSWLWKAWLGEDVRSVEGKCLMRMKLAGLYRDVRILSCCFSRPDLATDPRPVVYLRAIPQPDPVPTRELIRSAGVYFT